MKVEIKHWINGAVLFSLECGSVKECVEAAVKDGASLDGARLVGARLDGASLDGASLDGARLVGASLDGASLVGASLVGASLDGASLVAQLGEPNGWPAFCWMKDKTVMVQVGCKSYTLAQGREYWAGKKNRREVMAALDYAEKIAELREWLK